MMSRKFTFREKILLLVTAVLLLAVCYYQFVYKYTEQTIEASSTTGLEDELLTQQTIDAKIQQMKSEMENDKTTLTSQVPSYNNLNNEIEFLNQILGQADTFSLSFSDATAEGSTVRRDISVSFHTSNYEKMKVIVKLLYGCQYRCLIRDLNVAVAGDNSGVKNSTDLNVTLTVTFYETTYDANTTAGLATDSSAAATDSGSEETTE